MGGKKGSKKDYLQAKLAYYVGGLILFFHDSKKDYFGTLYKEHFRHTFVSLKFCRGLTGFSDAEIATRAKMYPPKHGHKRVLVLDLDETLIHCVTAAGQSADLYLPIKFPSGESVKVGRIGYEGSDKYPASRPGLPGADGSHLRGDSFHCLEQLLR